MSPPAPIVSLRGVGKLFGTGLLALDGLDLDVRDGEFLSLLGPSGCGKSTALRIIAGLSEPSRGTVAWRDGADARRGMGAGLGFVFQEPTLMPWTTVFGNVFLPLKLTGVDKAAAAPRIMATLSRVGLADFADAYPRELSGGMRVRRHERACAPHPGSGRRSRAWHRAVGPHRPAERHSALHPAVARPGAFDTCCRLADPVVVTARHLGNNTRRSCACRGRRHQPGRA